MDIEHKVVFQFFLAWLLGAFIGLERTLPRKKINKELRKSFGWLRSYSLIALLWAISVFIDMHFWVYFFSFFSLFIIATYVGISYIYTAFKKNLLGLTTEYSALVTYFIGILVMQSEYMIALILTIFLVIILTAKDFLEKISTNITRKELANTLKFSVVAFVVLPLLPDEKYSFASLFSQLGMTEANTWQNTIWQMDFFNPYSLWFFVVVMSAVWYVWYVLSKLFWQRSSVILSSILWWLVSSTAVTATMSEKSKKDKSDYHIYVVWTLLANCIMFLRVIFIVLLFNIALLPSLFLPAILMFIGLSGATYYYYYKSNSSDKNKKIAIDNKVESPFSILPAFKFWAFVLVVKFIAALWLLYKDIWGEQLFYYILGIISWLADVDAITQTMASQAEEGLIISSIAVSTILLAVISNNFVKWGIAFKFGERKFWKSVLLSFFISTVLWVVGIMFVNV